MREPPVGLDTMILKPKCVSIHWEFMFTRSLFQTSDMIEQHNILNRVAELVDQGEVESTLAQNFGTINAANLRRAHALVGKRPRTGGRSFWRAFDGTRARLTHQSLNSKRLRTPERHDKDTETNAPMSIKALVSLLAAEVAYLWTKV